MARYYKGLVSSLSDPEILRAHLDIITLPESQKKWDNISKIIPDCFCTMPNEFKTLFICTKALHYKLSLFKYIPFKHLSPDLCWYAITQNIFLIYLIPTKKKTAAMCNYAAKLHPEMILCEEGVPLTYRLPWMYEELVAVNDHYLEDIPEVYISKNIILKLHKKRKNLHIIRLRNAHTETNKKVAQDLLEYAWAPYRVRDWCLDIEQQRHLSICF